MNHDDVLDGELQADSFHASIKDCIQWWEKKRLFYNIFVVIIQAFIPVVLQAFLSWIPYLIFSFLFLIGANIFYTMSWAVEVLCIYYELRLLKVLVSIRPVSLVLGYVFSAFVTLGMYLDAIGFML